jgi:hypothetical protein
MCLDIVWNPFCFHDLLNLISFKCLFGELEKYLYNDGMITSRWLAIGKIEKVWIVRFV